MKSKSVALVLAIFLGFFGAHQFYLGKIGKGVLFLLTGGIFGIGWIIDIFTIGTQVDAINTKQELKTIRASTNAMLAKQSQA